MAQSQNTPNRSSTEINIREELEKYLRYWPWFVGCVILALTIAFLNLRQTTPVYSTTASIIIKDGKNGQNSEMAAFADLGLFSGMNGNSIENEIGILRSRRLMTSVVKALNLNIRYFDQEALRTPELYSTSPLLVKIISLDEAILQSVPGREFSLVYKGNNKLSLTRISDGKKYNTVMGTPVDLGFGTILVLENEFNPGRKATPENPILVTFSPVESVAGAYSNDLQVRLKESNSSLIELALNDPVRQKAEDILDQLILEYNREAIEDKNLVAMNTAEFIDERLIIINEELDSVESGKVEFKESRGLTDIQTESGMFVSTAGEYRQRQQEIDTQIELADAMISYLQNNNTTDLLPANLGIEESSVNEQINQYNDLVLERNRILKGSSERNPVIIKLNSEIEQLKANVQQSLRRMKSNLEIAENNVDRQAAAISSRISAVPSQEKQFRGIERQQQIKETLYLFLLQKREENSLSLAVTAPKAKIVDSALSSGIPVSPNPRSSYLTALLLGLGIPFAFLYTRNLLNNKVRERNDIEAAINDIPIVGEIPRLGKNKEELIQKNDRSVLAESFRILHTNLQYLLVNSGDKTSGINIFITSTIKGEGKTFVAFNLATTLANTGKKVLVMGGDLRNPQLQRFEKDAKEWQGVSDYLVNESLSLEKLIKESSLHENLYLLSSGSIPPNPSELLRHPRTADMFTKLRGMYDYVIVDTAPSMLVSDTFLINKYADLTLYVVRANYTEKKLLDFAADAKKDGKLQEVSFVLNDVEAANFGYGNKYGYAYGYAYGPEHEGFWEKVKSKVALW
ncbi:polysaccharide biosynthesis tyrosine autokinase [Zunongwangia sp. F260]|uniref:non-specific protein-tyrosine kinase n=1 Tax=Autumnicola lenta TaxID=3075593 RepID=A0ABU3CM66_9FLAO|nr:polysaccharide biosynthesis tyrosine autokinase [Zunongwangia sp. F260]MDT0647452.1 polysaccharide biosynthesis tyrosine autokinase [Zunongwangia sp. F260]